MCSGASCRSSASCSVARCGGRCTVTCMRGNARGSQQHRQHQSENEFNTWVSNASGLL
jgi:hypothetical protein